MSTGVSKKAFLLYLSIFVVIKSNGSPPIFFPSASSRMIKQGLGLSNEAMADVFAKWNNGPLNSYMIGDKIIVFQEP